jgi:phytoene dehydrogenase-like protein
MVSFILCDIARERGAVVATGVPVARVSPGDGVTLSSGDTINAPVVVSNADPRTTLCLLGDAAPDEWRQQVESVPITGITVKVNLALSQLPNFLARPGTDEPHHRAQVNTPLSKQEWRESHRMANAGELPPRLWTELYMHTVYDPTVAPPGVHTMSVFAQYVPYRFAQGTWDSRRGEVGERVIASIARFTSNLQKSILDVDVLGPPDIERRIGLTGGHIFQGEILPQYMWHRRLAARTPMEGLYLCGVGTYPGGSVIGIHGRNAAMEILNGAS